MLPIKLGLKGASAEFARLKIPKLTAAWVTGSTKILSLFLG
jgi:hypothetical protein